MLCHLRKTRTQLIDADDAVDCKIDWKDMTDGERRRRNRLARPGKAREKKLRQAGREDDERRCLRPLEPGAKRLSHEACRKKKHRPDREQLQRIAKRREPIDTR